MRLADAVSYQAYIETSFLILVPRGYSHSIGYASSQQVHNDGTDRQQRRIEFQISERMSAPRKL